MVHSLSPVVDVHGLSYTRSSQFQASAHMRTVSWAPAAPSNSVLDSFCTVERRSFYIVVRRSFCTMERQSFYIVVRRYFYTVERRSFYIVVRRSFYIVVRRFSAL